MQKIVPSLWFQGDAASGSQFYQEALPDTRILSTSGYPEEGLPDGLLRHAGQLLTVEVEVAGHQLVLLNTGQGFRPNPAISFMLNFDPTRDAAARERLQTTWDRLSETARSSCPWNDGRPWSSTDGSRTASA